MDMQNDCVIRRGKCLYDDSKEYEVKILKWHIFYGTGDYEDSPEIRDDRDVECYYVFYENLIEKGSFNACGGGFLSIDEAVRSVETNGNIKWIE